MNTMLNMNPEEIRAVIATRFLQPGFNFWFSDREHIRSPFPKEIREAAEEQTSQTFFEWIEGHREEEWKNIDDEEMVDMFETILFNEAIKLVDDEDQQLTISYPFLPRKGDQVCNHLNEAGKVTQRRAVATKDKPARLELTVLNEGNGKSWKTCFELSQS
jgi:hypothetical protein